LAIADAALCRFGAFPMPFSILAMPRASLVARGCANHFAPCDSDAHRIAVLFSSLADNASPAHPSHIAYRTAASAKQE